MRDCASMSGFRTAIAYVGSLINPAAMLLSKCFANLITFETRSTFHITDNKLFADIGAPALESLSTKVVRIIENPFRLDIIKSVKSDFF